MAGLVHEPGAPLVGAFGPTTKLELHISCKNLKNLDLLSKTDPLVIVYLKDAMSQKWCELGRTEGVKDNLSPVFTKSILIYYYFEEVQPLKFMVVDIDSPTRKHPEKNEVVGEIETTVSAIVGSKSSTLVKNLQRADAPLDSNDTTRGIIIVTAEEVVEQKQKVLFQIAARGLDKKDFLGKSDPFLRILKSREDGHWIAVHQTEEIKKTLDPNWKPFELSMQKLNNGDLDRTLLFQIFDWNKSGKEDLIGEFKASVRELVAGTQSNRDWELISQEQKKKHKSYKNSGVVKFVRCEITEDYSFFEYLKGGLHMSLVVAVDFTASNGDPNQPTSLHYRNPHEMNEYGKAIAAVGEILGYYDSDNLNPIYGFGGKFGPYRQVSHCYALTGDPTRPEVYGVGGLLAAYQRTLHEVELYGPTNFAPVITQTANIVQHQGTQGQSYTILLIITDGEITDLDATIEQIVKASHLPLSIVIVGVGNANFQNIQTLDADKKALCSNGMVAARDIVQFVPMNKFKGKHHSRLAAEVLAEVPEQLVAWMKSHNIKPNPPPAPSYVPTTNVNSEVFAGAWGQSIAPGQGPVVPPPAGGAPPPHPGAAAAGAPQRDAIPPGPGAPPPGYPGYPQQPGAYPGYPQQPGGYYPPGPGAYPPGAYGAPPPGYPPAGVPGGAP